MTIQKPYRTMQIGKTIIGEGQTPLKLKDYHWTDDQGWTWTAMDRHGQLVSIPEYEIEFTDLH